MPSVGVVREQLVVVVVPVFSFADEISELRHGHGARAHGHLLNTVDFRHKPLSDHVAREATLRQRGWQQICNAHTAFTHSLTYLQSIQSSQLQPLRDGALGKTQY